MAAASQIWEFDAFLSYVHGRKSNIFVYLDKTSLSLHFLNLDAWNNLQDKMINKDCKIKSAAAACDLVLVCTSGGRRDATTTSLSSAHWQVGASNMIQSQSYFYFSSITGIVIHFHIWTIHNSSWLELQRQTTYRAVRSVAWTVWKRNVFQSLSLGSY